MVRIWLNTSNSSAITFFSTSYDVKVNTLHNELVEKEVLVEELEE